MIGGATGMPSRNDDRAGHADAGAVQLDGQAVGAQLADEVEHDREDRRPGPADVDRLAHLLEHGQPAVGDRDVDRGRADVDAEEAQAGGEPDDRRPATAAGGRQARRLDQPDLGQPVELDGELRPGEVDGLAELGSADRPVVAQQPEQVLWCAFSGRMDTRRTRPASLLPLL